MSGCKRKLDVIRLRELLSYDPATGVLTWKVNRGGRKAGDITGCSMGPKKYLLVGVDRQLFLAHRVAWALQYGVWPDHDIDHVNGDRTDNRLSNLRVATRSENMQNARPGRHNTSGTRGVHWRAHAQKWCVVLYAHKQRHHIGYFDTLNEAADACARAKGRLHTFSPKAYCDA